MCHCLCDMTLSSNEPEEFGDLISWQVPVKTHICMYISPHSKDSMDVCGILVVKLDFELQLCKACNVWETPSN